jgi:hypothetical protein
MTNDRRTKNSIVTVRVEENGKRDTMTYYELSRWMSLMEGILLIEDKLESEGIPESFNWTKQNPLQNYIDSRCDSMLCELLDEQY